MLAIIMAQTTWHWHWHWQSGIQFSLEEFQAARRHLHHPGSAYSYLPQ